RESGVCCCRARSRADFSDSRKKKEEEDRRAEALDRAAAVFLRASPARVASFQRTIDSYRTGATQALIRNEREQSEIAKRIQGQLEQAFVLDDGRRVFKTEDGQRVFDEHGVEVGEDDVQPDEIGDHLGSWEDFQETKAERDRLREEHEAIVDYEEKLDEAEEALEDGEVTNEQLDALEAELEAEMPPSMRDALGKQPEAGVKMPKQAFHRATLEDRPGQQRAYDPIRPGG
ncbi:MAG: hypothetical protein AAFW60_07890, partial [Pseudomonadota bacterium]